MKVKVLESTTVIVRFQGGGTYPDREASAVVAVAGKLRSAFLDKAPKSGKFRIYKASGDATVGSVLLPNHAGDCIRFRLQAQLGGAWGRDVTTKCLRLNKNSATGVRIPGAPRLAGVPIRIRPEWKGNRRNTGVNGSWLYFKFVR